MSISQITVCKSVTLLVNKGLKKCKSSCSLVWGNALLSTPRYRDNRRKTWVKTANISNHIGTQHLPHKNQKNKRLSNLVHSVNVLSISPFLLHSKLSSMEQISKDISQISLWLTTTVGAGGGQQTARYRSRSGDPEEERRLWPHPVPHHPVIGSREGFSARSCSSPDAVYR